MPRPLARTVFLNKYNITCPPYPSVHTISMWALPVTVHAAAQHQLLAIIQFQVQVQISWFLSLFKKQWFKQQPQNLPLGCPAVSTNVQQCPVSIPLYLWHVFVEETMSFAYRKPKVQVWFSPPYPACLLSLLQKTKLNLGDSKWLIVVT